MFLFLIIAAFVVVFIGFVAAAIVLIASGSKPTPVPARTIDVGKCSVRIEFNPNPEMYPGMSLAREFEGHYFPAIIGCGVVVHENRMSAIQKATQFINSSEPLKIGEDVFIPRCHVRMYHIEHVTEKLVTVR